LGRCCGSRRLLHFYFFAAAAEEVEQAAAATRGLSAQSAATAPGQRVVELSLAPLVPAPARERLALLLELSELAPRVLDTVIHLEAFRATHETAAEDEEALEAAGVLHGRASALEHAVGLGDLLFDAP
jgi:hypothetical protein